MASRDLNFYNQFSNYENCSPPGVRLPEIIIDDDYYKIYEIDKNSCSNFEFLKKVCVKGLADKGIDKNKDFKKYSERLTYELKTLKDLGFIDYILLNWDILNFCHNENIPTGPGRGSAAGSLVLYLINVTKVDPIKYDLFFERFVSKSRARKIEQDGIIYLDGSLLADVDNDIAYEHRQKVISYIESKYPNRTAKILTLNTLSSKLCIKECGKIIGSLSEQEVNVVSDYIPKEFGNVFSVSKSLEESPKFKDFQKQHPDVVNIALQLEGLNKNTGVHPSGIAISYQKISDICPIQITNDGSLVTGYDMNWVSELMVKFDILGLRTLSAIYKTCELININPLDIDLDSDSIYNHLQELNSPHGLFQIEASANYMVCKKIKPKTLEELSAVIAIARPGAMDFADLYRRYTESGQHQSIHPFFDDVLDYTGGIPLYQEQLMKMAVKVGFTLEEAETLRRIVGKKKVEEMPKWRKKIANKVKKENLDPKVSEKLWKVAEDSANYSFNKSHSISYSILAAWTCYLKFNHPKEFFLSLLRMTDFEPSPQEEINILSQEMPRFGIKLFPPDLKLSSMDFSIENENIRYGLNSIKGISNKSLSALKSFIDSNNSNKYDIFLSAKEAGLNIGIVSSLIQAGSLSSYTTKRSRLVLEAQVFNLLTDREKRNFYAIGEDHNFDILNSIHLCLTNKIIGDDKKPIISEKRFETLKKKYFSYKAIYEKNKKYESFANWFFEKTLLGFSYSEKLSLCFGDTYGLKDSDYFSSCDLNTNAKYIGCVDDVFSRKSKNGNKYIKMLISDDVGRFDALLVDGREKNLSKFLSKSKAPEKNNIVVLSGTKGKDILFVNQMSIIDEKIHMKLSDLK